MRPRIALENNGLPGVVIQEEVCVVFFTRLKKT
jgi:hypothetical protein